ncbi:MAG: tRNA (N6-threonylcarbamoyladenosine(37)-N6)-methyltransferase TrmO [Acetobacteraceae bacterium]|jgi:tRNA-Thr(GGU) m(6)t(6)A37 methyltransferase TsaA
MSQPDFTATPIGSIATPWRTIAECPRNGRQLAPAPVCRVTLFEPFLPGLRGLEGMSHLILLYWLDQAKSPQLVFTPPFDTEPRGVFATRGPRRPNPIGLSVVQFDGFDGPDQLLVRFLDCVDGTPLLDIKPYLPTTDAEPEATMGWLAPHATRNANTNGR